MIQNFKILILSIVFLSSLLTIFYLAKNLSTQSLLAQISDFASRERIFESEILNLKEKVSTLEEKFETLKDEVGNLKNLKVVIGELEAKSEKKKEATEKKKGGPEIKSEKKEVKEEKICQNFNLKPKLEVIFNEICWMGDEDSPANEWIELKNVSQREIDLAGWQILNKNQKIKIVFDERKISPGEILVLERGDDFTGAIKNSDEALLLFDKNCNLEDKVEATSTWLAGDSKTKRTAERKKDFSWQTSQDSGGTPGKENSNGLVIGEEKEEKEKIESKITLDYPSQIFSQKEFDVLLSVSNLKYDTYDVKISILKISDESEQKRTISEISLTGEEWQDSYKYLTNVFTGNSFSGKFKLRIDQDFSGKAEIIAKIRQTKNRKVVIELSRKLEIFSLPYSEAEVSQQTEDRIIYQKEEITKENNLIGNEFFEEWGEVLPTNWQWNGANTRINKSKDALVGNFSAEITLTTKDYTGFYQFGKIMEESMTYYGVMWLKGKGIVRLGIKYPNSTYVYYGEETIVDTENWIEIRISRQLSNSGEDGGIKLNVKYDEEKGIPSGSKIIVGAAWLGSSLPPENWLK